MSDYGGVARYFDGEYDGFRQDVSFYLDSLHLERVSGPVLEAGCGTGRVARPLAEAGFRVTGVDSSEAMLRRARRRRSTLDPECRVRLRFSRQDLTSFSFGHSFGAAILAFSTFNLLAEPSSRRACLERIARHLDDRSPLLADMVNPNHLAPPASGGPRRHSCSFRHPQWGHMVEKRVEEEADPAHAATLVRYQFVRRRESDGRVLDEKRIEFALACLQRRDVEQMFYDTGFDVEAVYGDYSRRPFTARSPRMIFAARRLV